MLESTVAWESCLATRITQPESLKLYNECVQQIEKSLSSSASIIYRFLLTASLFLSGQTLP